MSDSAVSWAAIIAGALAAAAITLMLFALGSALGLSIVSPWPGIGASPTTFAVSTAIWLVIIQWVSSGVGGYLVGRLRTRWTGLHSDEVFFRDSAHGFLAWSLATLVVVALLASTAASIVGGTARMAGQALSAGAQGAAAVAAQSAGEADPFSTSYLVDQLFRSTAPEATTPEASSAPPAATVAPSENAASPGATTGLPTPAAPSAGQPPSGGASTPGSDNDYRGEVGRILARGISGELSEDDRGYLAQLIASRTGISTEDARNRVDQIATTIAETKTNIQQAADEARTVAATATGLGFLSLLIGAFIACVAAIIGGNQRDGLAPWRFRTEST